MDGSRAGCFVTTVRVASWSCRFGMTCVVLRRGNKSTPNHGMGESLLMENQRLPISQPELVSKNINVMAHLK